MADARKKQLVFNIIEFLRASAQDGTVKEEDREGLEVAIECIGESFGVNPDSPSDQSAYSIKPATLLSLIDVFEKTKAKSTPAPAATTTSNPATSQADPSSSSASTPATAPPPSAEDKAAAEALKVKGNQLMSQKLYDSAIEQYTEAIKLDANPVFYSNRAAAWGALGKHEKAVEDAQSALNIDPTFSKAYSRLGHAYFSLGEYDKAIEAYEEGLKLDPANTNMKASLVTAKARSAESSSNAVSDREPAIGGTGGAGAGAGGMPDLASLASMMGGMGGGAGGMPDLASLMQNPQMMAMAQQLMANGGLDRLMQNPNLRRMAEQMQSGGGMPDMASLMSDPSLREMAQQFMGGAGRGGA